MSVPYQIIPTHNLRRPAIETHINDNTEVVENYTFGGGNLTAGLFVFTSPKGRDREIITIKNGLAEFVEEYGVGAHSVYGQPFMNAYAAAKAATTSNAMLHCLRVTADDAAYSTATLIAKYKVDEGKMSIQYVIKPSDADVTDLKDLENCCTVNGTEDATGYTAVKLFTIAYRGRGIYGKNIRFRITTDKATDKNNIYKNYNFQIYRSEELLEQVENFNITFAPDAVYNNASIYAEDVMNDSAKGSNLVTIAVNAEGFKTLYDAYLTAQPNTTFTLNDFDALLGIDKYTRQAIAGLTIEPASTVTPADGETAIELSASTGIALMGGSDGALAITNADRQAAMDALYLAAFEGKIDENIRSKNRYPSTFIFDANFNVATKMAIVALAIQRTDCMAILDYGLEITTKASVGEYYDTNFDGMINDRVVSLEPYCMKVRDPYTQKTVTVTSTYWMASEYFSHINNWNGKHRPLAGNTFGVITGYIKNSVYPVFDDDLDGTLLDEMAEKHCNVAKFNQNQVIVRSMQNTAQDKMTALSEMNNVLVLLDIKRDCERACAQFEYDFAEVEDIARFNVILSNIVDKYAAAQVRNISAHFDKSAWESERGILHLYVEMIHKDLVKTTIIEIDVNRSSSES